MPQTAEAKRLADDAARITSWKRWGPYLAERAWGTVREDYSAHGTFWEYFPHDHARSRAYRWTEDGLAGFCDRHQYICFALALWNERDPILKERLFGLTGNEGNHGEDVKEYYFYLDSTPTHSYMRSLYKYPQAAFPYDRLVAENRRRGRDHPEFELLETGVFDGNRYFDVFVEYAKAAPDDLVIRITVVNRGPDAAPIRVLPTAWFRNTWAWGLDERTPILRRIDGPPDTRVVALRHHYYGRRWFVCDGLPELLFTENTTNHRRLFGTKNLSRYVKDGIHDAVVAGRRDAVNPRLVGTKASAHYAFTLAPGASATIRLRLTDREPAGDRPLFGADFDRIVQMRQAEADEFYAGITPPGSSDDAANVMRQAFAGVLWSKQFYSYDVSRWLRGDPAGPDPPAERLLGRNHEWTHLHNADVVSMPDKWEYPWYAAWDLAFHCSPLALVDPQFAKDQLVLFLREWYMHPNGQLPAYEGALGDVNPPVHAWAAWRVYKIEKKHWGRADRRFLERVFHKLLLNFTWWVNRKDAAGRNVFQGGFLGLDNIGVFDRSVSFPGGGHIEQSDATSWMGMYCLNMLVIALELAKENSAYEDVATKFFEHFVYIGAAVNRAGEHGTGLWSEDQGYYFDLLKMPDGQSCRIDAFTIAGLIPLFAIAVGDPEAFRGFRDFRERFAWFAQNRPELLGNLADLRHRGVNQRIRLALVDSHKLARLLEHVLNPAGLLSPHGVRSVSRRHAEHPFSLQLEGREFTLDYEPAEATSGMFGGNSNWRGPVWFPLNYLLIESLQKHDYFLGDAFQVACGEGRTASLWQVAADLSQRLIALFTRGPDGRRAVHGRYEKFQTDPHWKDLLQFHEYFDGDTGAGLGASHQSGWTALVAKLIQQHAEYTLQHRAHEVKPIFGGKGP
ncbi:MAG TPA: glucosidase [Nitrospiria bacterium]|nr:glucosidase [Nitrospiria bacterium]